MDRLIRATLGLGFLNAGILGMLPMLPSAPVLIFGIALLVTALCGWCPLYALFGLDSGRKKA